MSELEGQTNLFGDEPKRKSKWSVRYTSKSGSWETPYDIFKALDDEFHFTLDAASDDTNYLVKKHYTKEDDGLKQPWTGETVFCNPPYGKDLAAWVEKAAKEKATTVMLLPARTDVKWFHTYILHGAEVRFLKGRLHFGGAKDPAPFPSMVVIFRRDY